MTTKKALLVCGLLFGSAAVAQAGSVGVAPACGAGSFGSYATQNYICTLGAVDIFNFELYTVDSAGVATAAGTTLLNRISVTPTWNSETGIATILIGNFGPIGELPGLTVDATHTAAWMIRFTVDPPPVIGGDTIELDPPFGNIIGTQSYCADGLFGASTGAPNACSGRSGTVSFGYDSANTVAPNTPGSVIFGSPLATLDTLTTIRLNPNYQAGGVASGFDGIVFSIQTTPEPSAWILAGSGLVLLGRLRRRIR